jgi:hypothetical protein
MSDATEERRRWVSFTHATPNYGVQATVVPLRSTAAPDTRRYVKKGKLSGKKIMTKAIKDRMVGVWELAEAKFETLDGNVIEPYGPSPLGLGIITENGYLSAQIMRAGRTKFTGDIPTQEEKQKECRSHTEAANWRLDEWP